MYHRINLEHQVGLFRRLKRTFVGMPLATEHLSHELIPKWKALAVLS